jgi:hypothetical protein
VKTVGVVLVLAHCAAFLWAGILRKGIATVLWLNVLVSAAVVLYWVPAASQIFDSVPAVWCFLAFEVAVLSTSLLAVFRVRVPVALVWAEFMGHFLLSAAALGFILTFRITRLN